MKRESIDSMMNNAVDGFFFLWKRKARIRCAGEKDGGSAPVAEHAVRRTAGEEESGVAWNEKERRCVIEARGESKKHAEESKNKWRAIEKQGIAESKRRGRNQKARRGAKSESARARNQKACNLPTTL